MATREQVIFGSKFCRDCGGPITTKYGRSTCHNLPGRGTQKIDKQVCRILDSQDRNFCEHCGFQNPGPVTCSCCGEYGLLG